jgi:hypothetical protein
MDIIYTKKLLEAQSHIPERHHVNKEIYDLLVQRLAQQEVGLREYNEQVQRASKLYQQDHFGLPQNADYTKLGK